MFDISSKKAMVKLNNMSQTNLEVSQLLFKTFVNQLLVGLSLYKNKRKTWFTTKKPTSSYGKVPAGPTIVALRDLVL